MMKGNRMMFFIFMLGTFTVGMAEYVVTGLLTQIASDMKVSISSAGLLISVYLCECCINWTIHAYIYNECTCQTLITHFGCHIYR